MIRKKKNGLNIVLLLTGMILIVVDGFIMSMPEMSQNAVKTMLVASAAICALLIALMVYNIVREGRKIKNGEDE